MSQDFSVEGVLALTDKNFSTTLKNAQSALSGFGKNSTSNFGSASKSIDSMSSKATQAKSSIMNIAAGVGAVQLVGKAVDMVRNSVSGAISRFDTLNQYPKVMEQLGYSAKDVSKSMETLQNGIKGLPTALDDVVSTTQQFASITGDVQTAADTTIALNDAFLSSGSSAADAARGLQQYTQMLSSGKVDMMSWRTLQETMPAALKKVAEAFGYAGRSATNDLYAALQSGTITMDQLNSKFVELDGGVSGFANSARTASGGVQTSFDNLQTAVTRGMANMLTAIDQGLTSNGFPTMAASINKGQDLIDAGFKKVNGSIPSFITGFKNMGVSLSPLSGLLTGVATAAMGLVAFGTIAPQVNAVVTSFQNIKGGILAMLSPMGLITIGLTALAAMFGLAVASSTPLRQALSNIGNAFLSVFGPALSNTNISMKSVISTITSLAQSFGGVLAGALNSIDWVGLFSGIKSGIDGFVQAFQTAVSFVQSNSNWLVPLTAGIVGVVAGVAVFVKSFLGILSAINTVKTAFTTVTTVVQGFWTLILANPIVTLIAAIIAVVAALAIFFTTTSQGREIVSNVVQFIQTAWQGLVTFLTSIFSGIGTFFTGVWTSIVTGLTPIIAAIQNLWNTLVQFVQMIWTPIAPFFTALWAGIVAIFTTVWTTIVTVITTYMTVITTIFQTGWQILVVVVQTVWTVISTVISTAINLVASVIQLVMAVIQGDWSGAWNALVSIVSSIWNMIVTVVSTLINAVASIISSVLSAISSIWSSIWNGIKAVASAVWNGIKAVITASIQAINSVITAILGAIKTFWTNTWNGIKSFAQSVWNGMKSALENAMNAMKSVVTNVVNAIKRTFDTLGHIDLGAAGRAIMKSFEKGLRDAWESVKNFVGGIGDWIKDHKGPIQYDRKLLIPAGKAIMSGLNGGLNTGFNTVQDTVSNMSDAINDAMNPSINASDIGGVINSANKRLQNGLQASVNGEMTLTTQPAYINLAMGGSTYKAFVGDITDQQSTDLTQRLGRRF